jgi:hypothetical protein
MNGQNRCLAAKPWRSGCYRGSGSTNSTVALLLKLPRQQALVHSKAAGRTACTDRVCVCRSVTHRGLFPALIAAAGWLQAKGTHSRMPGDHALSDIAFSTLTTRPKTPRCTTPHTTPHHTHTKNNGRATNPTHDALWAHAPSHEGRTAPITAKITI